MIQASVEKLVTLVVNPEGTYSIEYYNWNIDQAIISSPLLIKNIKKILPHGRKT